MEPAGRRGNHLVGGAIGNRRPVVGDRTIDQRPIVGQRAIQKQFPLAAGAGAARTRNRAFDIKARSRRHRPRRERLHHRADGQGGGHGRVKAAGRGMAHAQCLAHLDHAGGRCKAAGLAVRGPFAIGDRDVDGGVDPADGHGIGRDDRIQRNAGLVCEGEGIRGLVGAARAGHAQLAQKCRYTAGLRLAGVADIDLVEAATVVVRQRVLDLRRAIQPDDLGRVRRSAEAAIKGIAQDAGRYGQAAIAAHRDIDRLTIGERPAGCSLLVGERVAAHQGAVDRARCGDTGPAGAGAWRTGVNDNPVDDTIVVASATIDQR